MTKETQVAINMEKIANIDRRITANDKILNGNLKRMWESHDGLKIDIKVESGKDAVAHEGILKKLEEYRKENIEQQKKSTSIVNAAFITILSSTVVGLIVLSLK